jgi:hypothetical protein
MIHTFVKDINFLHSGEEKLTYLSLLSNFSSFGYSNLDQHEFLFFIITQTLFLESFSLRQAS